LFVCFHVNGSRGVCSVCVCVCVCFCWCMLFVDVWSNDGK
jgi:hypothetical protein